MNLRPYMHLLLWSWQSSNVLQQMTCFHALLLLTSPGNVPDFSGHYIFIRDFHPCGFYHIGIIVHMLAYTFEENRNDVINLTILYLLGWTTWFGNCINLVLLILSYCYSILFGLNRLSCDLGKGQLLGKHWVYSWWGGHGLGRMYSDAACVRPTVYPTYCMRHVYAVGNLHYWMWRPYL